MKFIDENGEIREGMPITDEEIEGRAALTEILHEKICSGRYHGKYDLQTATCKELALYLRNTFNMSPLEGKQLNDEIDLAKQANAPKPIERPAPMPQAPENMVTVATAPAADDDIPW